MVKHIADTIEKIKSLLKDQHYSLCDDAEISAKYLREVNDLYDRFISSWDQQYSQFRKLYENRK